MSRREWRSLLILLALAVAGHVLRAVLVAPGNAPGNISLFDPATDGDPLQQQQLVDDLMRPLAAGERIDAEVATAAEFRRLPGIGPALAARIVADRQSRGPFRTLAGLSRVPGIGLASEARLAPHLQFSGVAADISRASGTLDPVDLNAATVAELDVLPGIGAVRAGAIVAFRDSTGPFRQLDDLLRVPGVSRALIDRIAGFLVLRQLF